MNTKRILLSFCRYTVAVLIVFARSVIKKMTGNAFFTTPIPSLTDVGDAVDDMEKKAALAKDGGKTAKSDLKKSRKKVNDLFRQLAWFVESTANGDENILTSSGFELSKDRLASQRDAFFVLATTVTGSVLIGCVAYKKAKAYLWFHSPGRDLPQADKEWVFGGASTQRKTILPGFETDQYYWFRYRAVTKDGMMEWSDPIQFYVK
jgi:hypothetical protein